MSFNYILEIASGKEARVITKLECMRLKVVCPYYSYFRRSRGGRRKGETIERPLLPGYIAISGNSVPFDSIMKISEVFGFLGFDGVPARISDDMLDYIESMTVKPQERRRFRPQDHVTVTDSPDWGKPVVYLESLKDSRSKILLECFGGNREVIIDDHRLEPAA
jgi:transcription antitermination factor NusG